MIDEVRDSGTHMYIAVKLSAAEPIMELGAAKLAVELGTEELMVEFGATEFVVELGEAELAEEHVVTELIVELGAARLMMELGDDGARGGARSGGAAERRS